MKQWSNLCSCQNLDKGGVYFIHKIMLFRFFKNQISRVENSPDVTCKLCSSFKIGSDLGAKTILRIMGDKYEEPNAKRI